VDNQPQDTQPSENFLKALDQVSYLSVAGPSFFFESIFSHPLCSLTKMEKLTVGCRLDDRVNEMMTRKLASVLKQDNRLKKIDCGTRGRLADLAQVVKNRQKEIPKFQQGLKNWIGGIEVMAQMISKETPDLKRPVDLMRMQLFVGIRDYFKPVSGRQVQP
jgi:hypothetical protein